MRRVGVAQLALWLLLAAGCVQQLPALPREMPAPEPQYLVVAYRVEVLGLDREWWDSAVWLGQGCRGPVHADLILPDGRVLTATTERGVAWVQRDYAAEAGWWEFQRLPVTRVQARAVARWCTSAVRQREAGGYGYDWGGVARFVCPWAAPSPTDYFCSEAVCEAVQRGGYLPGVAPWQCSPYRLRVLLAPYAPRGP